MERTSSILALLTLIATGLIILTPAATEAATPGCVTAREYNRVRPAMSPTTVRRVFGTGGFEKGRYVEMVYDGMGDYDESGNRVGYQEAYVDEFGNFIEEQGGYAREVDHVRSYKKCRSFDRSRGRVGVLFDNYTYGVNGAYAIHRYHPTLLMWWNFVDSGRSQGKSGVDRLGAR